MRQATRRIGWLMAFALALAMTQGNARAASDWETLKQRADRLQAVTGRLLDNLEDYFRDARRWRPRGRDELLWNATRELDSAARRLQNKLDERADFRDIRDGLERVELGMDRVESLAASTTLNNATRGNIASARGATRDFARAYASGGPGGPTGVIVGGSKRAEQLARDYLRREYSFKPAGITILRVKPTGSHYIVTARAGGRNYELDVDARSRQVYEINSFEDSWDGPGSGWGDSKRATEIARRYLNRKYHIGYEEMRLEQVRRQGSDHEVVIRTGRYLYTLDVDTRSGEVEDEDRAPYRRD